MQTTFDISPWPPASSGRRALMTLALTLLAAAPLAALELHAPSFTQGSLPGTSLSGLFTQQTVVGGSPSAEGEAGELRSSSGTAPLMVIFDWLRVTQAPTGVGRTFRWVSDHTGSYVVELGGDGTPGSGVQLRSADCLAATSCAETILDSELPDNVASTLYVIVHDGVDTRYRTVRMVRDSLPPTLGLHRLVVRGRVADTSITSLDVDGQTVEVVDGGFEFEVTSPEGSIVVTARTSSGSTFTRRLSVLR